MTFRSVIASIVQQEDINFLLTNRIPRRLATQFFGWFSQIEQPFVRDLSIGLWRLCSDLDLSDARQQRFRSLHDCFIRQLRDGARPVDADPNLLVSPCDAIVGAAGLVEDGQVLQIKGFPYRVRDLFGDENHAAIFSNGCYVTLRLTATMYHHFHAPHDCLIQSTTYVSGDTWNVNPIALKRVERLFCKNERAVIRTRLSASGHSVTLVPVAAILVASLRLSFLDPSLDLRRAGPRTIRCDAAVQKGEAMGWFQHGSTIIVFAPKGFRLCETVRPGAMIRVGQPLMRLPEAATAASR
ncbi:archaetidylserine decarboxylase [Rhodopila sp.]|uniref:archaetidylserine decarboxylase n=1 Tax=Rhodopila sp. TaxID=2480087 RepID=UPI003D099BD6